MQEKNIRVWVEDNYYALPVTVEDDVYKVRWKTGELWFKKPPLVIPAEISKRQGIAATMKANRMDQNLGGWTKIKGPVLAPYDERNIWQAIESQLL